MSTRQPRRSSLETRERVLAGAGALFYANGIRATGVDAVAAAVGVAPVTLYRLFPSKGHLVGAYIDDTAERYRARFLATLEQAGTDPRSRVLAIFDALTDEVTSDECRGCPFQLALAELPAAESLGRQNAVALKDWVRARLVELAQDATGLADPHAGERLGEELVLVMEGVYAMAQTGPAHQPARRARDLVERLLDGAATPTPRT